MDYFHILNLEREPFSTSPDPDFFYHSRQHVQCLQQLELSLRLRRGLNVVVGEVGTGKTTLCRRLIQQFAEEPEVETHLVLDPDFADGTVFLAAIGDMIAGPAPAEAQPGWRIKERIKTALFEKGVTQGKIVVLIIDEGQKLHPGGLEILRELLNYETNAAKLLQIVIFAQTEFEAMLRVHANFADRISLNYRLGPLSFADTCRMIRFRLVQAGAEPGRRSLFTAAAMWAIYRATGGYPRKIIHLCHKAILAAIIQNRRRANRALVRSCVSRSRRTGSDPVRRAFAYGGLVVLAVALVLGAGKIDSSRWTEALTFSPRPAAVGPSNIRPAQSATGARANAVAESADFVPTPAAPTNNARFDENRAKPAVAAPPKLLGLAAPGRNESLSWMMVKIYGRFSDALLGRVMMENPQIEDPGHIAAGWPIRFPAVAAPTLGADTGGCWIQLGDYDRLDIALDALRHHPPEAPAVRLVPWWTAETGTRFAVVLHERFDHEKEAFKEISAVSQAFPGSQPVIAAWNHRAVYFADPFLNRQRAAGARTRDRQ